MGKKNTGNAKKPTAGGGGGGGAGGAKPKDVHLVVSLAMSGRLPTTGSILSIAACAISPMTKQVHGVFSRNLIPVVGAFGEDDVFNFWRSKPAELDAITKDQVPCDVGLRDLLDFCKPLGKVTLVGSPLMTSYGFLAHAFATQLPNTGPLPWGFSGTCAKSFCSGVLGGVPVKDFAKYDRYVQWCEGFHTTSVPANDCVAAAVCFANAFRYSAGQHAPLPITWPGAMGAQATVADLPLELKPAPAPAPVPAPAAAPSVSSTTEVARTPEGADVAAPANPEVTTNAESPAAPAGDAATPAADVEASLTSAQQRALLELRYGKVPSCVGPPVLFTVPALVDEHTAVSASTTATGTATATAGIVRASRGGADAAQKAGKSILLDLPFLRYPSIADPTVHQSVHEAIADGTAANGEWVVTEKVHGANFSLTTDGRRIRAANRTAWLSSDDAKKFFGFDRVTAKAAPAIFTAFKRIREQQKHAGRRVVAITVFGEIAGGEYHHPMVPPDVWGRRVQAGVQYSPSNFFFAFDIAVRSVPLHTTPSSAVVATAARVDPFNLMSPTFGQFPDTPTTEGEFPDMDRSPGPQFRGSQPRDRERPSTGVDIAQSCDTIAHCDEKCYGGSPTTPVPLSALSCPVSVTFLDYDRFLSAMDGAQGLVVATPLARGSFLEAMQASCEIQSTVPETLGLPALPTPNYAEGVVVRPVVDRWVPCGGDGDSDDDVDDDGATRRVLLKRKHPMFREFATHGNGDAMSIGSPTQSAAIAPLEILFACVTAARVAAVASKHRPCDVEVDETLVELTIKDAVTDAAAVVKAEYGDAIDVRDIAQTQMKELKARAASAVKHFRKQ